MFHHVVLMKLSDEADSEFHATVERYCERIRRSSPHVRGYICQPNTASRRQEYTWAIVSGFDTEADHEAYQTSALHQEMAAYMAPFIERIVACDMTEVTR